MLLDTGKKRLPKSEIMVEPFQFELLIGASWQNPIPSINCELMNERGERKRCEWMCGQDRKWMQWRRSKEIIWWAQCRNVKECIAASVGHSVASEWARSLWRDSLCIYKFCMLIMRSFRNVQNRIRDDFSILSFKYDDSCGICISSMGSRGESASATTHKRVSL